MKAYPVHEYFYSWQGEGVHMGRAAFFVRLYGCPVKCPWCDSAGTWHPDYRPKDILRMRAEEIASKAHQTEAAFVVITGGEPTIHDLTELTGALEFPVHLETSGGFEIKGDIDWMTLSPKWLQMPLTENLEAANEFKIIVEDADCIERWTNKLEGYFEDKPIWLQPEWSQRSNEAVLNSISNTVKSGKGNFRAGYQFHKLYKADLLDPNSAPEVPLGGVRTS